MAYEITAELQAKIDGVKAAQESLHEKIESVQAYNNQIAQELEQAEEELQAAIVNVATHPSEVTRLAELEARSKVQKLKIEDAGAAGRESIAFQLGYVEVSHLKNEALSFAQKELRDNYVAKKPEALERIENAKREYMNALLSFHELTMKDTQGKYYEIAREVNLDADAAKATEPNVFMDDTLLTYRSTGFNYYGIFNDEVLEAFKRGNLKRGSLRG